MRKITACLGVALLFGCSTSDRPRDESGPQRMASGGRAASAMAAPAPADRKIVRNADLVLEVGDLVTAASDAQSHAASRGGVLESSVETGDESRRLVFRVPAESLDSFLAALKELGDVERSSVSSRDVTEQHADLAVRLENSRKLRERLRVLLDRANTVQDMLAVERELARVQTEVERLQGQLDRLDSQVSMSSVELTLRRGRILGPLGYVGYSVYWVLKKLFVIR